MNYLLTYLSEQCKRINIMCTVESLCSKIISKRNKNITSKKYNKANKHMRDMA